MKIYLNASLASHYTIASIRAGGKFPPNGFESTGAIIRHLDADWRNAITVAEEDGSGGVYYEQHTASRHGKDEIVSSLGEVFKDAKALVAHLQEKQGVDPILNDQKLLKFDEKIIKKLDLMKRG